MFKAFGSYNLPFGTGRMFLNNSKALDEAIGGWTLSATWLGEGGHPFTPYMLTDNSYASAGASNFKWYPNQVGSPKAGNFNGINGWFDVGAFAAPTPGTFGNMRRNSVYGPGVHEMNASIRKTFPIWERVSFDFSADATNVLNHPSFGSPDAVIGAGHTATIRSTTVGGRNVELIGKLRF